MPGGTTRTTTYFDPYPLYIDRGEGCRVWDIDGTERLDVLGNYTAMILGHAHPKIVEAIARQAARGTGFAAANAIEVELASILCERVPSLDAVRFCNSGTEATMFATRLARAFTGRNAILKFEGCYHGHADSFLVHAGSGVATLGLPDSPGVPPELAALTLTAPFNDLDAAAKLVRDNQRGVAAIIVEPVVGNSGFIPPDPGFLQGLRALADTSGALLIFDEVMTGFRIAPGGAKERFGVTADLTTLGKVIGGGLPVAVYGGRRDIMKRIAPSGPVYQAGTLSGNPLAMAAGIATLTALTPALHARIEKRTVTLVEGLQKIATGLGVPFTAGSAGSMWGFFFNPSPVRNFTDAKASDVNLFRRFFHAALDRGVYLAPSAFESCFMSAAHGDAEVAGALEKMGEAMEAAIV